MNLIITLIKKELKDYFISPIAYIVICVFILGIAVFFSSKIFIDNNADMRFIFEKIPLVFVIFIPLLTMRSWSEEKRDGTIEVLSSFPVSKPGLILSKFLSTLIFVVFALILTFPIPLTLNIIGEPDNGVIIASYFGAFLLGAACIAIGQFISINTQNQIISVILSVVLIFILFIVGEPTFLKYIPIGFRAVFESLGLGSHYYSISKGLIDSKDIIYYISIICFVLFFINKSFSRIRKTGR